MLTLIVDFMLPAILFLLFMALVGTLGMGFWALIARPQKEQLCGMLRSVAIRHPSRRPGPPIYSVHLDGQMLYASGKEDVEDFLCTTWVVAGRQIVRLIDTDQPATILLTCGSESVLIEINQT